MTITLQPFKANDTNEAVMRDIALPTLEDLGNERDTFYNECWESYLLGDILYELIRDPMSGVITQDVYRQSFPAIHELFTAPGTFEFYLSVFRSIWGENVDVEFVVPGPGQLTINLDVLDFELGLFAARKIVDSGYIRDLVVTEDGDNIVFQGSKGIKTQKQANALIYEISMHGVYTIINLTL